MNRITLGFLSGFFCSVVCMGVIYIVVCSCSTLIFIAVQYSATWVYQIYLSILPLVSILSCFQVLTVMTVVQWAFLVGISWCHVHVFPQGLYLNVELLGQRICMSSPLLDTLTDGFPSGCLPLALSLSHNCSSCAEGRKPQAQNCWSQEMLQEGELLLGNQYVCVFVSFHVSLMGPVNPCLTVPASAVTAPHSCAHYSPDFRLISLWFPD